MKAKRLIDSKAPAQPEQHTQWTNTAGTRFELGQRLPENQTNADFILDGMNQSRAVLKLGDEPNQVTAHRNTRHHCMVEPPLCQIVQILYLQLENVFFMTH